MVLVALLSLLLLPASYSQEVVAYTSCKTLNFAPKARLEWTITSGTLRGLITYVKPSPQVLSPVFPGLPRSPPFPVPLLTHVWTFVDNRRLDWAWTHPD